MPRNSSICGEKLGYSRSLKKGSHSLGRKPCSQPAHSRQCRCAPTTLLLHWPTLCFGTALLGLLPPHAAAARLSVLPPHTPAVHTACHHRLQHVPRLPAGQPRYRLKSSTHRPRQQQALSQQHKEEDAQHLHQQTHTAGAVASHGDQPGSCECCTCIARTQGAAVGCAEPLTTPQRPTCTTRVSASPTGLAGVLPVAMSTAADCTFTWGSTTLRLLRRRCTGQHAQVTFNFC